MVPVDSEDPQSELARLREELAAYSTELSGTPFCVGLSKVDVLTPGASLPEVTADEALRFIRFSSVTREGLEELLEGLWEASHAAKKSEADDNEEEWWSP
jgi:GTPase involved in cell partitioning and DNA repair